jgi:Cytochrome c oxidase assembly protein COX16
MSKTVRKLRQIARLGVPVLAFVLTGSWGLSKLTSGRFEHHDLKSRYQEQRQDAHEALTEEYQVCINIS